MKDAAADNDSVTVQRARKGSLEAFEPLVLENAARVIRLAYHMLGDWDEARDLAQETFARAYLCLSQFDAQRPFSTWLCTIAARLAADRLRHRRVVWRAGDRIAASVRDSAGSVDPDMMLSLRQALGRLTPRQRQAVVLCDLHGFSATEASAMIGCSASTVRVLRLLASRRLRDLISAGSGIVATPAGAQE